MSLITGKDRGSAHQDCNLKLRVDPKTYKLPVVFHNLRGYDSHFIMQEIGKISKEHSLSIELVVWVRRNCFPYCFSNFVTNRQKSVMVSSRIFNSFRKSFLLNDPLLEQF